MSLWKRLKTQIGLKDSTPPQDDDEQRQPTLDPRAGGDEPPRKKTHAAQPSQIAPRKDDDLALLKQAGTAGGPGVDDVIAILRQVRGTIREAEAVAYVLGAKSHRHLADPVLVACADILAARGDEQEALRVLDGVASISGLILTADLNASLGQIPRALSTIERVLARQIDTPGARERHQRWRLAMGLPDSPAVARDEATLIAPTANQSPFRLLREVARGGAGTVYEAEDEVLGRRLAFKVYHSTGHDRLHREREAQIAAALAGPGIVRVFDANPREGWIALEWISRGSVRDILRTGDTNALLPIERWARPLAFALARIHARGFVHADVKPANVLLRQLQDPVLSDFGLARPIGSSGQGGSPGYVSPERLAGRPSDPRDDIYGYGRILEDVLIALDALHRDELKPWRQLMLRCIGPDEHRPLHGSHLVDDSPR